MFVMISVLNRLPSGNNQHGNMMTITDEILMAYVDGELDDRPELRDYIASHSGQYSERMQPFIFTRQLFTSLRCRHPDGASPTQAGLCKESFQ
jgi:hypothetical protein